MSRLFAIDSMAVLYRGYFAMIRTPLINSKGLNTSGIFGLLNQILKVIESDRPEYLAVVADSVEPTFRHQQYPEYKATREKMPEDLVVQLPYLPKLVQALGLPYLIMPGFEADDIIGTLMKTCREQELEGVMVTSDKDYMQLIDEKRVMLNHNQEIIGIPQVLAKFGCAPHQVIDVLGLMGDSSDNVPGVRGIGEKTAIKLIQEFGSIAGVYANLEKIQAKKLKENLITGKAQADLSRELVTIHCEVPLQVTLEQLSLKPISIYENEAFHQILEELEFKSILKKLRRDTAPRVTSQVHSSDAPQQLFSDASEQPLFNTALQEEKSEDAIPAEFNTVFLKSPEQLLEVVQEIRHQTVFAIDFDTNRQHFLTDQVLGLAFVAKAKTRYYLPWNMENSWQEANQQLLHCLFADPAKTVVTQDAKALCQLLNPLGVLSVSPQAFLFDVLIAHHLVEASERTADLSKVVAKRLKRIRQEPAELKHDSRGKKNPSLLPTSLPQYTLENAEFLFLLYPNLKSQLEKSALWPSLAYVEMPLARVLAKCERWGVNFDRQKVQLIAQDFMQRIEQISQTIFTLADQTFNINSVVELQKIIYEKLALHEVFKIKPKKIKLGIGLSTDEETLEKMAAHEIIQAILRYRELTKLKNTYVDQLPTFVMPSTSHIHTSFRQNVAATGRLASDNPNLQNIPIRSEEGRKIRALFIPSSPDHQLLSADYSQIELRIVAHYSKDPTFLAAYRDGLDIHALTASAIFNVAPTEVTREMRSKAKEVNFGLIYRMGPERLSIVTQSTRAEARIFIDKYFAKYATIHALQESFLEKARKEGYARTLLGRRRYLAEINGKGLERALSEGAAINTPIQGSAAEIIKLAMIAIDRRLQELKFRSKMILTVHDELVFDAVREEISDLSAMIKTEMENVVTLAVPLTVEIGVGENWLAAH